MESGKNLFKSSAKFAVLAFIAFKAVSWVSLMADERHSHRAVDIGLKSTEERRKTATSNTMTDHAMSYFLNADNMHIYWKKWLPKNPTAVVILVHGYAEHINRYDHVAAALNKANIAVYGLDHQGHGLSEGDRGYMVSMNHAVTDIIQLTEIAKAAHADKPFFIVGHSMGSLLTLLTALREPTLYKGVVVSAPPLIADPKVATPMMKTIAGMVGKSLPKLPLDPLPLEGLSTNKANVDRYVNDPLIYRGGMLARMASEFLVNMDKVRASTDKATWPLLVLHGDKDLICLPEGSKEFYEGAASSDKKYISYPGYMHEIFNEHDAAETSIKDMVSWIKLRI